MVLHLCLLRVDGVLKIFSQKSHLIPPAASLLVAKGGSGASLDLVVILTGVCWKWGWLVIFSPSLVCKDLLEELLLQYSKCLTVKDRLEKISLNNLHFLDVKHVAFTYGS